MPHVSLRNEQGCSGLSEGAVALSSSIWPPASAAQQTLKLGMEVLNHYILHLKLLLHCTWTGIKCKLYTNRWSWKGLVYSSFLISHLHHIQTLSGGFSLELSSTYTPDQVSLLREAFSSMEQVAVQIRGHMTGTGWAPEVSVRMPSSPISQVWTPKTDEATSLMKGF